MNNSNKKTICLNMIVKNESGVIKQTLENLCLYIDFDYWVIVDTGSTDNTILIIQNFFKEKNIEGEIISHDWVDFGYNRTKALEYAYNKTDYLMVFDADDRIHGSFKLPTMMDRDKYSLIFGQGFTYNRVLIINNKKKWMFKGVLHEYLMCLEPTGPETLISGSYYVESGRTGNRSQDPLKYEKDAKVLEVAFEKEMNNDKMLASRYAFYCAQSYKDCKQIDNSIKWYLKCLDLNGWAQEKYYSCISLGDLYKIKGDFINCSKYWLRSMSYDPERIEGIVMLCNYYRGEGLNIIVNALYHQYKVYNHKPVNKLFLFSNLYDDQLEYNNAICAYYTNDKQSGYECCKQIILNHVANPEYLRLTASNLYFYADQMRADNDGSEMLKLFYAYDNLMGELSQNNQQIDDNHYRVWDILFERNRSALTKTRGDIKIKNRDTQIVFLSLTTCKRIDLFKQTINSLLNQWTDLDKIDYWYCVDDNSSKKDRKEMKKEYGWIDYYFKNEDEKGHRSSMNIIWNKLKASGAKYWIHLEDDFLFYKKMSYVSSGIKALNDLSSKEVKQILFNRNYGEIIQDYGSRGHINTGNKEIVIHDHKLGGFPYKNCHYWPNYSFRPSIIDAKAIIELGNYETPNQFFELDYAKRWTEKGYKSGFFNLMTNRHIGRLTSERNNKDIKNAYELNQVKQFNSDTKIEPTKNSQTEPNKNPQIEQIKIVNLKRRIDRKQKMTDDLIKMGISKFEFIEAVDGLELKPTTELKALFSGNDFRSRSGVIGCALSHYNLWNQLINDPTTDYYVILEDDIEFSYNFRGRLEALKNEFKNREILFIGYSMFSRNRSKVEEIYKNDSQSIGIAKLEKQLYIGGTFSYSINKKGARELIDKVRINGIKHGIDYFMKIMGDNLYESRPQLVFSEWNESGKAIDTDIQNSSQSVDLNTINLMDNFVFIRQKDLIGNDIYINKKSIEEMLSIACRDTNCDGFNTLGFFKKDINITKLTISKYFGQNDGIYVKKMGTPPTPPTTLGTPQPKFIRIKMLCNWCNSEQLCREWSNMCESGYRWKNIEITSSNENIDYYVIINKTDEVGFDPKKTIIFQMEPWVYDETKNWGVKTWGKWAQPDESTFMKVYSHKNYLNAVQWQINIPLKILDDRDNSVCSILSNKNFDEGHIKRIEFIKFMEDKNESIIKIYGRENYHKFKNYVGVVPIDRKENALMKHKYCISVENNQEVNYATEKIWEPILCECLCFYWGCPNLEDYLDKSAFIRLDLNNYEESVKIIKQAIEEDWWSQRIDIIRNEKQKILNNLGFFPTLNKSINVKAI